MMPPENNDSLDALLREQNQYVADDGFTKRVVASLPKRRARRLPRYFLLGVAVIGWVAAGLWLPWGNLPQIDLSSVSSIDTQTLWPWVVLLCVAGSLIWATLAAFQWED
jgi:Domain of unknown function (DUF5056)